MTYKKEVVRLSKNNKNVLALTNDMCIIILIVTDVTHPHDTARAHNDICDNHHS